MENKENRMNPRSTWMERNNENRDIQIKLDLPDLPRMMLVPFGQGENSVEPKRSIIKEYYTSYERSLRSFRQFKITPKKVFLGNNPNILKKCIIIKKLQDLKNITNIREVLIYQNDILLKEEDSNSYQVFDRPDMLLFGRERKGQEFKIILNSGAVSLSHFGFNLRDFFKSSRLTKKVLYWIKAQKQKFGLKILIKILQYIGPATHETKEQLKILELGSLCGTWLKVDNQKRQHLSPDQTLRLRKNGLELEVRYKVLKHKKKLFLATGEEFDSLMMTYSNIASFIAKDFDFYQVSEKEVYVNSEKISNSEVVEILYELLSGEVFSVINFIRTETVEGMVNSKVFFLLQTKNKCFEFVFDQFTIISEEMDFYFSSENEILESISKFDEKTCRYKKQERTVRKNAQLDIEGCILKINYFDLN